MKVLRSRRSVCIDNMCNMWVEGSWIHMLKNCLANVMSWDNGNSVESESEDLSQVTALLILLTF